MRVAYHPTLKRVVAVEWSNGDRYYGRGPRLKTLAKAAISRFVHGRRSR